MNDIILIEDGGEFGDSESTVILGECPTVSPTMRPTRKPTIHPTELPSHAPSVSIQPTCKILLVLDLLALGSFSPWHLILWSGDVLLLLL